MQSTWEALRRYIDEEQPGMVLISPSDANFESTRACFVKRNDDVPLAIVRPQSPGHVQAIVRYCTTHGIDFVVRSGGHDCAGRSQVNGALTIDMRDIAHVRISTDEKTAVVGGGILMSNLAKRLEPKGLVTPMGTVASVGYVGWATLGGYGPFCNCFGLGVDQIVGATIVDAHGELVVAKEDLLKGIRGGGGTLGIITELTIKVYPLRELLVSLIVYESSNLEAVWNSYTVEYEKMMADEKTPRALQLQPFGLELPNLGRVLAISATWADADQAEGRKWFAKVAGFCHCLMNNPEPRSVSAFTEFNESLLVFGSWGRGYTLNLEAYTPHTARVLAKYTGLIPGGGIALSVHTLHAPTPNSQSVFGSRFNHLMVELVAMTGVQDLEGAGAQWARAFIRELRASDAGNILDTAYVSLLGEDDSDYKRAYGDGFECLVELKKTYDPDNVFKYAVPRLVLV
ncbi:FAD-binding domain-containing protein [Xylariaceae sp. FL1272]|nr:FAD-binding domain-containing protein [Xylariaceae sp. FL1272]